MKVEETFARVLRRTLKRGYDPIPGARVKTVNVRLQTNTASFVSFAVRRLTDNKQLLITIGLNDIIFDHGFAIALWGESSKEHLQQLALLSSVKGRISYIRSTM